jgi:hypothetical protein
MGHLVGLARPRRGIDQQPFARPLRPRPLRRRHRGQQLVQRTLQRRAQAQVAGHLWAAEAEQRPRLRFGKTGEVGPEVVQEPDPPVAPALGVDRDAGRAERVEVPQDGPLRHLQPLGQLPGREPARALELQQNREESVAAHRRSEVNAKT